MMLATERRSRYARNPEPEAVQETPRVARICFNVWRHRFLTSEEIAALDGGSRGNLTSILRRLVDNEYLDLPEAQKGVFVPGGGRYPTTYGLDLRGADLVRREFGVPVRRAGLKEKNRKYHRDTFKHTRGVASFMVRHELACRAREDLSLLYLDDVLKEAPTAGAAGSRHKWPVRIDWQGKRQLSTVVPDKIFALRRRDQDGGVRTALFFLEYDRGTESDVPSSPKSSPLKKLLDYAYTHREGLHRTLFGASNFRVLFVTKSERRAHNIINLHEQATSQVCPAGTFLFTHEDALKLGDILTHQWVNARREPVRLVA